jgi:chromosome segregation ATPase
MMFRLTCAFALASLLSLGTASAQQPAPGKQRPPRLTTDDVVRPVAEPPVSEGKEGAAKPEEAGKPETAEAKDAKDASAKSEDAKAGPEEAAWRDRVGKARDRAMELERAAEEAELGVTQLRNNLGASGESARYRNETAAELDHSGKKLIELRAQARAAAADLQQLVDYGREKGFREAAGPKPTSDSGEPNEQYFTTKFARLKEAMQDAERRVQLYDNRVRDLGQRILQNGGKNGGDNFYSMQLQQDRDDAQQKLDEARAAFSKALTELDNLKEEARRAGLPPGLFR